MTAKPNEIDPGARIHDDEEPVSDYGTLPVPPSDLAGTILSAMTPEEKTNFNNLLGLLQAWSESACGTPGLLLHPQARASLWGAALAKMADHFRETGHDDRALFFVGAAWNISRHPIFAFNAALLSFSAGDTMRAKSLLQDYLAAYQGVLKNSALMLASPEISSEDLETLAVSARSRLAAIEGQT